MKMRNKTSVIVCIMSIAVSIMCTACGSAQKESDALNGSLSDIMVTIYDNADLSKDFREALTYYGTYDLTEDMEVSILGTDEIDYLEGIVSMPMNSSIAYQCVLLRVNEEDVATVKQQIKENADLGKWICVSAETMLIESRENVIFFVMGDQNTVYALNSAFQNL